MFMGTLCFICAVSLKILNKGCKKLYAESMKNTTKESKAGKEIQGPSGSGLRAAVVRSLSF